MSPLPLTLKSEGLGDGIMVNGELRAEMGNSAAPVGVSASAEAALPPLASACKPQIVLEPRTGVGCARPPNPGGALTSELLAAPGHVRSALLCGQMPLHDSSAAARELHPGAARGESPCIRQHVTNDWRICGEALSMPSLL